MFIMSKYQFIQKWFKQAFLTTRQLKDVWHVAWLVYIPKLDRGYIVLHGNKTKQGVDTIDLSSQKATSKPIPLFVRYGFGFWNTNTNEVVNDYP